MLRKRSHRRGVLLLVVLSVLVLFMLLTVTFVVVASKERTVTKSYSAAERSYDPPAQVLDSAAMMLFRDTADIHSPFFTQSLLEHIYGNVSFRGTLFSLLSTKAVYQAGGQFILLYGNAGSGVTFNSANNYYKGCVMTMLSGKLLGQSARIVASSNSSGTQSFTVMSFGAHAGMIPPATTLALPANGDLFLVNGPAYSGMGRGYDPTNPNGSAATGTGAPNGAFDSSGQPYALLPNQAFFPQPSPLPSTGLVDPAGPGGANVDYTAPDYNNMYLGLVTNGAAGLPPVLPSFHRPDLYQYWASNASAPANWQRRVLFRPNPTDHPVFAAYTNPGFNPASMMGPFDVDNMGSGTADSVWIDPGFPVMVNRDGRTYKVLVAPLLLDLDGRVNVNAHGSAAQFDPNYQQTSTGPLAGAAGAPVSLPVGIGWGPADVNIQKVIQSQSEAANLLGGGPLNPANGGSQMTQGRYGPGISPTANRPLTWLKLYDAPPNDYRSSAFTSWGTPGDIKGRRCVGLDFRGQPLWITPGSSPTNSAYWGNEIFDFTNGPTSTMALDNPYGIDLGYRVPRPGRPMPSPGGSVPSLNNPFTVAEFERVQRLLDNDVRSLPPRLYSLLQNTLQTTPARANQITPESWDVPMPAFAVPRDTRAAIKQQLSQARAFNVTDMIRAKLMATGVPNNNGIDAELAQILPPEMLGGLRMDINRPLGNGHLDNNKNGLPDYPGSLDGSVPPDSGAGQVETLSGTGNPYWPGPPFPSTVSFNLLNGVQYPSPNANPPATYVQPPPGVMARQLMARYLYVLMMAFTDQGYYAWTTETGLSQQQQQELTSRRVAQWAINCVCFRDTSSVMTPFEYQADIFQPTYQGWLVDGDPGTDDSQAATPVPGRRLVWGCKPPDALLTETFAMHDKRAGDTMYDGNKNNTTWDEAMNKMPDTDFDQVRVPQGSLFIELYCCRYPNNPVAPGDLYTYNSQTQQWALDLGRNAPDGTPVWRMAITENARANPNANAATQVQQHPDSVGFQSGPDDTVTGQFTMNMTVPSGGVIPPVACHIQRIIWLGDQPPPANSRANVFYNRNKAFGLNPTLQTPSLLLPGSYAVVGPRGKTWMGAAGNTPYGQPAAQSITLAPNFSTAGTQGDANPGNIKQPVPIICAADPPAGNATTAAWTDATHTKLGIGVNVSEPLPQDPTYYPEPTTANPSESDPTTGSGIVEFYGDPTKGPFKDGPMDYGTTDPVALNRPLTTDGVQNTGTYPFYKTVFLQRLADPSAPWHVTRNPYITVDWMPIDLNTFNGEEIAVAGATKGQKGFDPNDPNFTNPQVQFSARQRGNSQLKNQIPTGPNVWAQVQAGDPLPGGPGNAPPANTAATVTGANFPFGLTHTFGYLNQGYGQGFAGAAAPTPQYVGDPQKPFPWITWNARPYASVMEMLLVPASSPDRLLVEFNAPGTISPPPATPPNPYDPLQPRAPYRHLLNFFNTANVPTGPTDTAAGQASNYYRALEYMTVPSRFIGTETYLNPTYFGVNASGNPVSGAQPNFLPPFNTVSNYRDPGKINLNTITSPDVFAALLNLPQGANVNQLWADFCNSRTGGSHGGALVAPTSLPTGFADPFRAAAAADLVPLPAMVHRGVDVTLLRPSVANPAAPLFDYNPQTAVLGPVADYNNTDRNPYFRYQVLQRLANNVTTRSNVFAVWLTIGYFEALPNTTGSGGVDAGHPDGYMLGGELGATTGDIERHRAFYIFDRSIPVGYERGQNHNINRAILLKRFIE